MDWHYLSKIKVFFKKNGFTPTLKFGVSSKNKRGFTLVEILVVISISAFVLITLLTSTFRSRLNMAETVRVVVSDIRTAQANALSSKQYNGTIRCGYGIHLLTANEASNANLAHNISYFLYVSKTSNCGNNGYNPSDSDVILNRVIDSRLQLCSNPSNDGCNLANGNDPRFQDIFFQSPDSKSYINNKSCTSSGQKYFSQILVRKKDTACSSSNCIYICVYPTGKIETGASACSTTVGC